MCVFRKHSNHPSVASSSKSQDLRAYRLDGWNVLEKRSQKFTQALRDGFAKKGVPLKVEQHSSLFWIHGNSTGTIRTIEQIPANQGATFKGLFLKALDKGVYLAPNAYEVGFVSMAHTDELLAEAAQIIVNAAE